LAAASRQISQGEVDSGLMTLNNDVDQRGRLRGKPRHICRGLPVGTVAAGLRLVTDEIERPNNRVDRSANGEFIAFWRGQVVYANGRVKKFETESDARQYLTRCDAAGKIIH
jgi:hypothetical protein